MLDYNLFDCGDITLQSGQTLPEAKLAYKTYGQLNAQRDNAILFPTWFAARHSQNEWLIGEDRPLDPRRWFIIAPNLFGNGLSSSPSTTPSPFDRAHFPRITIYDNVLQHRRLLTEQFGIDRLALIIGRSMGAMQAFQFSCLFPDAVNALIALTGAARTSPHNYVFLASLKAALTTDSTWNRGNYDTPPIKGLQAFGRIYAGWIYSREWYRAHNYLDEDSGIKTLEDFLSLTWDRNFADRDANNLLSQIDTWQHFDISKNTTFNGNFEAALASITARSFIMPGKTDMYFPPEDSAYEVSRMPNAELRVIQSIAGHRAGSPVSPAADIQFVADRIHELLET